VSFLVLVFNVSAFLLWLGFTKEVLDEKNSSHSQGRAVCQHRVAQMYRLYLPMHNVLTGTIVLDPNEMPLVNFVNYWKMAPVSMDTLGGA
jgi:hypothetical protein